MACRTSSSGEVILCGTRSIWGFRRERFVHSAYIRLRGVVDDETNLGDEWHVKTNAPISVLSDIVVMLILVSAGGGLASAQVTSPCTAILGYPVVSGYSNSNVQVVVPISATCATSYGSQLYATGSAYDVTSNTGLGSTSTVLTSVNGGTEFNGQLGFNLSPTVRGNSIQISVSISNGQSGNVITATSETVEVGTAVEQTVTTTVTESEYPYADPYPTAYSLQPNEPSQFPTQLQSNQTARMDYQSQTWGDPASNTNLLDYVAIIAILASVIIATTGLVLVSRRQPARPHYLVPR